MATKSYKRFALSEKDNAGCMWRLTSMFNFPEGHATGKLLPVKKHGNDPAGTGYLRVKDLSGLEEKHNKSISNSESEEVDLGITTIKRLMEEEMSRKHLQKVIPNEELQCIISDFRSEVELLEYRKKHRERSNKSKEIFNAADSLTTIASMDNQRIETTDSTERSSINFDLAAFLVEFYGYGDKCHVESKDILNLCVSLKNLCEKLQSHRDQPNLMLDNATFRRELAGVAEDVVTWNSINEKRRDEKMCFQSNELIDTFKILNSKRELLLKLLQDPDSPLFQFVQDNQNAQVAKYSKSESDKHTEKVRLLCKENGSSEKSEESGSAEMYHKQSKNIFFWKKHKTKGTKTSRGSHISHPLNKIVVLKPNPERMHCPPITRVASFSTPSKHNQVHEEDGERGASRFSLDEIKKRLKHAFLEKKKEKSSWMISRDRMLHKIPVGCKYSVDTSNQFGNDNIRKKSARRLSCANEKSTDILSIVTKKNKKLNANDFELSIRRDCTSTIPGYLTFEEARSHLSKRRFAGDQINSLCTAQVSKSSGKILSCPDYNVPPCRTSENKKETTLFILEKEHLARKDTKSIESLEVSSGFETKESSQLLMIDSTKQLVDSHMEEKSYVHDGLSLNQGGCQILSGNLELHKAKVHISKLAPYQSELHTELSNEDLDNKCDRFKDEYSTLGSDSSLKKSQSEIQADSSPSSPIIKDLDPLEQTAETFGGPIPVPILKTIVSEDIISPGARNVDHDKLHMQPRQSNSEYNDNFSTDLMLSDTENNMISCIDESQAKFQYIEAVLQAAGLTTTNEFLERWLLGDKLFDPSLFDEVITSFCPVLKDRKLLFDYIGDVLVEIHERYCKHGLHSYFINSGMQPALSGEKLMKKVVMVITRHNQMHLPKTVDEIIEKDLLNEVLVDFQLETENIGRDVFDTILDDLVEEAVFDMWF